MVQVLIGGPGEGRGGRALLLGCEPVPMSAGIFKDRM